MVAEVVLTGAVGLLVLLVAYAGLSGEARPRGVKDALRRVFITLSQWLG